MWLDQKYIGLLSSRLERFKRNNRTFNFRCPVCGDSTKHKNKARGYLYEKDGGGYLYHCHNCNISMGLDKFIKFLDERLYKEYVMEKLSETGESSVYKNRKKKPVEVFADKMKTPTFIKASPLRDLKKISQLQWDHPAKQYVARRKIPTPYQAKLFYTPKFKKWVNSIIPNKFESIENDEPRLVIPFLDEDKNLFGFQGRSFSPTSIRYITIMLDANQPKIYNLENCDRSRTHYIFEGPIDSMFVNNAIAMAGGSIDWSYVNDHSVFVYDNEPRSKETCAKIQKVIDKGHKVVIFPETVHEKDINDMVLSESVTDVNSMLMSNISNGLEAKLVFNVWKKV